MADKAASFTNTNTELVKMIESIKG